jgi:hypothetical protein
MPKQTKNSHSYESDLQVQPLRIVPSGSQPTDRTQRDQRPLSSSLNAPQAPERETVDRLIRKIKKI